MFIIWSYECVICNSFVLRLVKVKPRRLFSVKHPRGVWKVKQTQLAAIREVCKYDCKGEMWRSSEDIVVSSNLQVDVETLYCCLMSSVFSWTLMISWQWSVLHCKQWVESWCAWLVACLFSYQISVSLKAATPVLSSPLHYSRLIITIYPILYHFIQLTHYIKICSVGFIFKLCDRSLCQKKMHHTG